MSTPKTSTSSGTITTPPPRPVNAPRKPAASDPSQTRTVNSQIFMDAASRGVVSRVQPTCHAAHQLHTFSRSLPEEDLRGPVPEHPGRYRPDPLPPARPVLPGTGHRRRPPPGPLGGQPKPWPRDLPGGPERIQPALAPDRPGPARPPVALGQGVS